MREEEREDSAFVGGRQLRPATPFYSKAQKIKINLKKLKMKGKKK